MNESIKAKLYRQHWKRPNDSNGNPKRLYVFWDEQGDLNWVQNEGYSGMPRLESDLISVIDLGAVNVEASSYKALITEAKRLGVYYP